MFKRILLPTDFSDYANNALEFGITIANLSGAVLDIVHFYHVGSLKKDLSPAHFEYAEKQLFAEADQKLDELGNRIKEKYPTIQFKLQAQWGIPEIAIQSLAKKEPYDLIVMGTKGTGTRDFLGSTTTNVIDKLSIPTLVIPLKANSTDLKHFVWASDLEIKQASAVQPLFVLAGLCGADITTVYVREPQESETTLKANFSKIITHLPADIQHKLHLHTSSGELLHELSRVVHSFKTDLLCMVMRERTFIERFLDSSLTTQLAENVDLPLLILHKSS